VEAKQFVAPSGSIVESAALLGDEVNARLRGAELVRVDLSGLRGLSSSYFNTLLQRVVPMTGIEDFPRRVELVFDSAAQEQVFARSMDFLKRSVA
jgi:hypothetical protein